MKIENSLIRAVCVDTKTGVISTPGGKKPVFIMDLVDDHGEVFVKFFNVNLTSKKNYTTEVNSDFAKLYRLSTGVNPGARLSRSDQLLRHLAGIVFMIESERASGKRGEEYNRVTHIKPENQVVTDDWTTSGHLIKNVRANLAKNWQPIGKKLAKSWQKVGKSDSAQSLDTSGLDGDFNPIPHLLSNIGTSHISLINTYKDNKTEKNMTGLSPPLAGEGMAENKATPTIH